MQTAGELLRRARKEASLSQEQLAARAGTSAATISAYECGAKEPRLSTLARLVEASGAELVMDVRRILTREERRTLELHKAAAAKLRCRPEWMLAEARRVLETMRQADPDGHSDPYFDTWERLMASDLETLLGVMASTEQIARNLRQASPFAALLTQSERLAAFRKAEGAEA